jgi:uncharacterized protein
MHYFIDGYNLLFRLKRSSKDDLKSERQKIIQDLNEKVQILKLDATIVFDSQYHYGEAQRTHYNFLEILFSAEGETADDMIINELKSSSNPRLEIVVTSDKLLAWRVRRLSAKTESIDEFLGWLDKRYKKRKREAKSEKTMPAEPSITILEPAPAKGKPSKAASPEECFDYYLHEFEQEFEEKLKNEPPPNVEQPPSRYKEKQKKIEEPPLSDEERWLKIFEDRSREENNL